ncbi:MAG TPA: hypothetical protein VFV77_03530 [Gammaproteobacteria bacterium]|nr:hypothetical protein [Gammaproteobacteria bacterium]
MATKARKPVKHAAKKPRKLAANKPAARNPRETVQPEIPGFAVPPYM